MVSQTQPCLNSSNKPLLADASLRLDSQRKLFYSNGVKVSATDQAVPEDGSTPETDLTSGESTMISHWPAGIFLHLINPDE